MKYVVCPDEGKFETFSNLEKAKKRAKELGMKYIRRFREGKLDCYETTPLEIKEKR